jgi:hypothetical protein
VELPRRSTGPQRAISTDPDLRVERPAAAAPQSVGGRFDRGLRRITAERTQLLSWLVESDQAVGLRTDEEIDLRADPVIDVRSDGAPQSEEPVDVVDGVASSSPFQR